MKLDEDPKYRVGFFNKDAWKFKKEMLRWKDMHKTSAFRDGWLHTNRANAHIYLHLEKNSLSLLTISVFQSVWIDVDTNWDTKPHNQLASQPINPTTKGYNMMAQTQAIGNFWWVFADAEIRIVSAQRTRSSGNLNMRFFQNPPNGDPFSDSSVKPMSFNSCSWTPKLQTAITEFQSISSLCLRLGGGFKVFFPTSANWNFHDPIGLIHHFSNCWDKTWIHN